MNTFEVIKGRRSVKYYDPEFTLTAEEEQMIFQAAIDALVLLTSRTGAL